MRERLSAVPALVLDPNELSPDGSLSLTQWMPSPDGRLLAYGISKGGADWRTVYVKDLDAGKDLRENLDWVRFSDISWTKDARGFFYSRYPEPPKGKVLEAALSGQMLCYHRIGTPQSEDKLIYSRPDIPTWFISGSVTEDGRYLLIFMFRGSDNQNRLYFSDLGDPKSPSIGAPISPLVETDDAEFLAFGNSGATLYLRTDQGSPNRSIIAMDLDRRNGKQWETVIPERKEAIESVNLIGGRIVVHY